MSAAPPRRRAGALVLAALLVPTAALADYPFVLPSSTNLSGENAIVTFDAAGSDHVFFFDHRPLQFGSIAITRPDGSAAEPAGSFQSRYRSVFDVRLDRQGTWKVASVQSMIVGTFKLGGEERRVGGRGPGGPGGGSGGQGGAFPPKPAAGPGGMGGAGEAGPRRPPPVAFQDIPAEATDVHLTEMVRTAETFVTLGAPTADVFKPSGKGLEFDPITHPNSLAAGETARFSFLIDGKPAAGIKVTLVPGGDRYREDTGAKAFTTGADGVVAITWKTAGMYWLGAEAADDKPSEKRAETRALSLAVTLEVATP